MDHSPWQQVAFFISAFLLLTFLFSLLFKYGVLDFPLENNVSALATWPWQLCSLSKWAKSSRMQLATSRRGREIFSCKPKTGWLSCSGKCINWAGWLFRNMLSGPALYVDHDDQPNAVYVKQSRTKVGIQVSYLILCILYPVFNLQTQGYPTHCTGCKNNHQLQRWWWGGDKAEVNLTRFWMKKNNQI